MSERVNIDLDLVENGGDGLYVADDTHDGILVLEERPGEVVSDEGGHVTTADEDDDTVYRTASDAESGDVYLVDVESGETVETIFAAECGPYHLKEETMDDRGLVALSLVN